MRRFWRDLYSKVRADVSASLATGGLGVAALFVLDYVGVETSPEQKAAIATGGGWLGGKVAAWLMPERHPAGAEQLPRPTPPMFAVTRE